MTSAERMYALWTAVRWIVSSKTPGDIVECGVWKGGSSMLMALTLLRMGDVTRSIFLFDTFTGMTEPTERDGTATVRQWRKLERGDHNEWAYGPLSEVQRNLSSTGYPTERVHFIQGPVEETLPSAQPTEIALLRLDTDWYELTRHELVHLYPRLQDGGVLVIDDYGHWAGARAAVDEYFESNGPVLLSRVDYTGRLSVKRSVT